MSSWNVHICEEPGTNPRKLKCQKFVSVDLCNTVLESMQSFKNKIESLRTVAWQFSIFQAAKT